MQTKSNEFQEYEFDGEEERLRSHVFNPEQLAMLHNQRAGIARDLLNLNGTRKDYDAYLEQDIHLKGQLHMINFLLDNHHAAIESLNEIARSQSQFA